jgi:hypothetical protein
MDHPGANLLRHPAILEPLDDTLAQLGVFDQFTLSRTPICSRQLGSSPVIPIAFWHTRVREMISLQLPEYR